MNRSVPRLVTLEIMLRVWRVAGGRITGGWPLGAKLRPWTAGLGRPGPRPPAGAAAHARDHAQGVARGRAPAPRRLALGGDAAAVARLVGDASLVAPVDRRLFGFGARRDLGVVLGQPGLDRGILPFERALDRA